MNLETIPQPIKDLARMAKASEGINGYDGQVFVVGGSVRDLVMGRVPHDFDVEVFSVQPEALEQMLASFTGSSVDAVGKSFGVLKWMVCGQTFDVATPRRENKTGQGHRGFIAQPDPTMTFEEAARRRDFTMNAMMLDPLTGDLFDPFGGYTDIMAGNLSEVDPQTFREDPLRVLRAAQFCARFGLSPTPNLLAICESMKGELKTLARERVGGEWEKLLASDQPSRGVWLLLKTGALEVLHPELAALENAVQDKRWHPEGDVLVHTMMALDEAAKLTKTLPDESRRPVMWAVLMHDVAKPWTTVVEEGGAITSHDHANEGGPTARRLLVDQFNVDLDTVAKVGKLVEEHMVPKLMAKDGAGPSAVRRLAKRVEPATMEELLAVSRADTLGRGTDEAVAGRTTGEDWLAEKAKNLGVEREGPKPLLMGRHLLELGMSPGKAMGVVLKQVFEMQLDGTVTTLEDALAAAMCAERGMV